MKKPYSVDLKTPHPRAKYGWIIFAVSVLFVFYKYALEVSPSIMTKELMREFHIDAAILGQIAASYYYAYTLMQIPGGLLIDAYGPRIMTTVGLIICTLGALVFSYSQTVFIAALSRFLMGLGATFAILNTLKVSSNWFPPKRFALLTGLTLTLGLLGAVFGQAPLSYIMHHVGWRQSFHFLVIFGFLFALIFWLIVRDRPKHPTYNVTPRTKGKVKISVALAHILKRKQTWILSFYSGLAFAPFLSFAGLWGVSFLEVKYQLKLTDASFFTSLIFIGFAIGAPLFGWYSSYIKKRKPIMFFGTTAALLLILTAVYLPPFSHLTLSLILFFFGFTISGFLISFTVIHEINVPLMTATAIGIMNTFNALIGALTEPLIGLFLDLGGKPTYQNGVRLFALSDYHYAFIILPLYLLICIILLFFIKETSAKQTLIDKPFVD